MSDDYAIRLVQFTRKLVDEFATEGPREDVVLILEGAVRVVLEDELGADVYARVVAEIDGAEVVAEA